jgi:hypothetical protein
MPQNQEQDLKQVLSIKNTFIRLRTCNFQSYWSLWMGGLSCVHKAPCSIEWPSGQVGASVAKWLAHLPFTSEAAGSNLTKYFLNATRTQSSCEKSKSQRSAESRGFSTGTPVSSHRES